MNQESQRGLRFRIALTCSLFVFIFLVLAARSFQLQILKHERLNQLVERQYQKNVALTPKRGVIYDRKGRELAVSIELNSLYAHPAKISDDKKEVAKRLSSILKLNYPELKDKLNSNKPFVWIERKIPSPYFNQIKELRTEGIGYTSESKRFYPNGQLAGHLLGFAGLDSQGLEGIEKEYDSYLKEEPSYLLAKRDALGENILLEGYKLVNPQESNNLVLTIDKNIQYLVEKELENTVLKSKARGGMAVVMVPSTGELLALAVYPSFNPNSFGNYPPFLWRNRVITDSFEPGSTFKIFLLAAILEEKLANLKELFFCENGSYRVGRRVIHDVHKYGWLNLTQIIKFSSNIGASKLAERLGKENFYRYIRDFGFGEKTGIDLPGEVEGIVPPAYSWSGIGLRTISFGQGISVTSIQLITALSSLANGGILMKPYLVKAIIGPEGKLVKEFYPQRIRRVISSQTAEEVSSILKNVVEEGGTGEKANLSGFSIAGKTGTAQKVEANSRYYSKDKRMASFIGFVPADDPKIAILVVIDEPKGVSYGGVVAAPTFKKITEQTLTYLNIFPQGGIEIAQDMKKKLEKRKAKEKEFSTLEKVEIVENLGGVMPDFSGMSIRQVLKTVEDLSLEVKIIGSGKAIAQYPPPGSSLSEDTIIKGWVKFQPPS